MFYRIFALAVLIVAGSAQSMQDILEPKNVLPFIRAFISNPTITEDIDALVRKGCVWSAESISLGGGIHVTENNRKEIGGRFTVFFNTRNNRTRELSYFFGAIIEENEAYTITSIRRNNTKKIHPEC